MSAALHERAAPWALVLAFALALVASLRHVAAAFAVLEADGATWPAIVAAVAVDLGMLALLGAVAVAARRGRSVWRLLAAVGLFAGVSALANLDAAAAALAGGRVTWAALPELDPLDAARALVFSAVLPVLVLVLASAAEGLARPETDAAQRTPPDSRTGAKTADSAALEALETINATAEAEADRRAEELAAWLAAHPGASTADAARALDWPRSTTRDRWRRAEERGMLGNTTTNGRTDS